MPSPPRHAVRAALVPVACAAAVAAGLAACGSSGSAATAPTVAQISQVLAERAAAVLERAPDRFLAGIDTGAAAVSFRVQQRHVIDNLRDVPLDSWSYAVQAPVTDREELRRSTDRYGAPAAIVRVQLSYALRGVDALPVPHDQWLTFVRRGSRVLLAGDDDLADAGGQSWQGPWDFGPLASVHTAHALVLGPADDTAELRGIGVDVDAAVPAVTAVWGVDWSRQVAVVVPAGAAQFGALAGPQARSGELAAVAVDAGTDARSGAVLGQRLVVNRKQWAGLSGIGRGIVLRHELTHIAAAAITSPSTPRWLVEGFAEYVANRTSGQTVRAAAAELAADVARGAVPEQLPRNADFAAGNGHAAQAYQQGWLACRLIAERAGAGELVRFYRLVAGAVAPPEQALADALQAVLHETPAQFVEQWRGYLVGQLR